MPQSRKLLVTSALPYANGPIHLGHLVEYIQTDIWVRYQRLRGHSCTYVCADDTHGTPIMLKAEQEGMTPEALIARVGEEHARDFADFGISFDYFGSTHCPENEQLSRDIYERSRAGGHIARRTVEQAFDPVKNLFLPDRFIKGTCPRCHSPDQYGDSCEVCGATYAPSDLENPVSALSGATPVTRSSEHYFFRLGDFTASLKTFTETGALQPEAANKLREWLDAGLTDWDISRDAPYFGFSIPDTPDKFFYVWLDAPIGYIATLWRLLNTQAPRPLSLEAIREAWGHYETHHFIGKDILYFHALFWPAMLEAAGLARPHAIHAHGFLTINGKKMSKSRGTFITARDYLAHLPAEYLRYYLAAKLSSHIEDIDLNFDDFRARVNADLVGKLINIASRSAQLLTRFADGRLGTELPDLALFQEFAAAGDDIGAHYEQREYSHAIKRIMDLADRANRYVDDKKPWEMGRDPRQHAALRGVCTQALNLFRVLMAYLQPVLPAASARVSAWLGGIDLSFESARTPLLGISIEPYQHLMRRVEEKDLAWVTTAPEPPAPARTEVPTAQPAAAFIDIADFGRVDLRVAAVIDARKVEGADKLLQLSLDLGEGRLRTVFAGIRRSYDPQTLIGRHVVCVANLAPRTMRFGVSEGMVLAAGDGEGIFLLGVDTGAKPGMPVH